MSKTASSIMIVAGEPSGDRHAAGLVYALRQVGIPAGRTFFGSGGKAMAAEGVELLADISKLAAIGPAAAMLNLLNYVRLLRLLLRQTEVRGTDLAILVDFPDFNLPLARRLHARGVRVCYFIGPQVWAWRRYRVKHIRRFVDLMLVIFPFEESFYRRHGVEARYVGNPTASRFASAVRQAEGRGARSKSTVALLPGSRRKEVELLLPLQLDAASYLAQRFSLNCLILCAPGISPRLVETIQRKWEKTGKRLPEIELRTGAVEDILPLADCAVVKSGTSTLEAMLAGVPFAMMYRLPWSSWLLLRPLVPTQTFCLANLVAGRQVVPEFVQREATGEKIGSYLAGLLGDPAKHGKVRSDLREASEALGSGDAYGEAARWIARTFFPERDRLA